SQSYAEPEGTSTKQPNCIAKHWQSIKSRMIGRESPHLRGIWGSFTLSDRNWTMPSVRFKLPSKPTNPWTISKKWQLHTGIWGSFKNAAATWSEPGLSIPGHWISRQNWVDARE